MVCLNCLNHIPDSDKDTFTVMDGFIERGIIHGSCWKEWTKRCGITAEPDWRNIVYLETDNER